MLLSCKIGFFSKKRLKILLTLKPFRYYTLTLYQKPIQRYTKMLKLFIFCVIIIGVAMLFLCVRILFKRNGRFVKTHVSQSKAMRERGIGCVQSQDFAMRHKSPYAVKE